MKTVVVTGGSAGIGLAIAERFAKAGWQVALLARDKERLAEAREMLAGHGPRILDIPTDVGVAAEVDRAAERVVAELGGIDAWVNNAMSTVVAPADKITPEEYQRVTATTYLSQVYGTLAALRSMKPRNRGAIIQVSSGLAIRSAPLQAAYCGAKAAVGGFTDSLRSELIADRSSVTLSVIYLPAVNTPQPTWARNRTGHEQVIPDPLFDPRLCAEAVYSAVRDPQREIWVGRSTVMMALAQALAPGFADRKAAGMREAQEGAPMAPREGNLEVAVRGPARIDGPSKSRTLGTRQEFVTSRQVDLVKAGAVAGVFVAGLAARSVLSRLVGRSRY
ncbi:SDR family oxidoreductase [Aureimonas sp. AU40]|uniref:SDR family oxidoreductase n=1 Tax=Aureimonas sp. AU40 TaxID=1637747 RepID=UPI0007850EEA|nr:SDR family oxidoreductase [Aureimonas sp. AU40]